MNFYSKSQPLTPIDIFARAAEADFYERDARANFYERDAYPEADYESILAREAYPGNKGLNVGRSKGLNVRLFKFCRSDSMYFEKLSHLRF